MNMHVKPPLKPGEAKAGYKVRCLRASPYGYIGEVGKEYAVKDSTDYKLKLSEDERNGWCDFDRFELVAKAKVDEPKFKVGDRVRVVKSGRLPDGSNHGATIGAEVTLRARRGDRKVFWTTDYWDFYEHEIELVVGHQPPTSIGDIVRKHSIVCAMKDGQPQPATRPYLHDSIADATAEAERLADKIKGTEFGVYALVNTRKLPAPVVYAHEWQRLAKDGQKINAIKQLRNITGIGLKAAKDAVEDWLRWS